MAIQNKLTALFRSRYRWAILAGLVLCLTGFWWLRGGKAANHGTIFKARQGNLAIKILEGGSVEAEEAQEIRSQIKGYQGTKILRIVDEGYLVTEQDIKDGKVLVELDSSDLRQRIINEDIQYQSTLATLIDAQQAFDIQLNQNLTDIKAARQKARFARMDLEKYMGEKAAAEIIAQQNLYEDTNEITLPDIEAFLARASADTNLVDAPAEEHVGTNGNHVASVTATDPPPAATNAPLVMPTQVDLSAYLAVETNRPPPVDFTKYADIGLLGDGSAKQQLRKLLDDLQMAQAQQSLAKTKLDGTRRLFEKAFVPKSDLDSEELNFTSGDLKIKTAQTALDLFRKYEFPKSAEEYLSKYDEGLRGLTQTRRAAIAKLAQARARLKSSEGRFKIESDQRRELYDQMDKCVIKAEKCGLVVYGTDGQMMGGEQIREGATVRERQRILTIPDMNQMAVKIKIHESFIKKITKDQRALIKVDAYSDVQLSGAVSKVAILPDYQNRWLNPDIKVYITMISIDQAHDWLKPGMSAKVEILVRQLTNVVYVPLQCVRRTKGRHVCHVVRLGEIEQRDIEVGDFNDEFIEIKSGLKEGEKVLLRPPEDSGGEEPGEERSGEPQDTNEPDAFNPPPARRGQEHKNRVQERNGTATPGKSAPRAEAKVPSALKPR